LRRDLAAIVLPLFVLILAPSVLPSSNLSPVLITTIQTNSSPGATFGGGRQLVVENENGIFMTYWWRPGPSVSWIGYWNLLRSTDGGRTFDLIYTPHLLAGVPALETDQYGNIHLISHNPEAPNQPWYYYRFLAKDNYKNPRISVIPGVSMAEKYFAFYDPATGKMYLFNNEGMLMVLNSSTGRLMEKKIYAAHEGQKAYIQYPNAYVDDSVLYHAWTTQHWKRGTDFVYWDIHFAWSPDGGGTWRKADGTELPSRFIPDSGGPTDNIVPSEEFDYHTWLNSMTYKNGKVHFAYLSNLFNGDWVYVRIDMVTGKIDKRSMARGETITLDGNGGFFATAPGKPLYMVSTNLTHICALVSYDNGDTWHDAAVSEKPWRHIEYISGYREITSQGILGCFTGRPEEEGGYRVGFFRIPLSGEQGEPPSADFEFTVKPTRLNILQGESLTTCATIASEDSFQGEVELAVQELPPGLEVTFNPFSGSPDFTSTILIAANGSVAPGVYGVPVFGKGGGKTHNFSIALNVSEPPPSPDFDLEVEPRLASIGQGETMTVEVSISPLNDFSDYSSLSVHGLPEGVSASFTPAWGKAGYISTLTVSTDQNTPPGTYDINVTAVGGGNRHTCTLQLVVKTGIGEPFLMIELGVLGLTMISFRRRRREG